MDDTLVSDPAREELEKLIAQHGSQTAAARKLDISASLLNDIILGKRNISRTVLSKLGFVRVTIHVREDRLPRVMKAIEKVA